MTYHFSKEEKTEIIEGFKNGEILSVLGQKFKCSYGTMRYFLEKNFENYKEIAKKHQQENARKRGQKTGQLLATEKQKETARKHLAKWREEHPEEQTELGRKAAELSMKSNPSKQEILFSLILANENIQFIHQFSIFYKDINNKKRVWFVDFFVFPNIIVQLDGVYYHCRYEKGTLLKDWLQNQELKKQGFKVIRFWDFEIDNDLYFCIKRLKETFRTS